MKLIWKDGTSYSQGDKNRVPRIWDAVVSDGDYRTRSILSVHRHIHYGPTAWLVTSNVVGFDCRVLKATDVEEAKREGVKAVIAELRRLANLIAPLSALADGAEKETT
jgi:hypothetical protein